MSNGERCQNYFFFYIVKLVANNKYYCVIRSKWNRKKTNVGERNINKNIESREPAGKNNIITCDSIRGWNFISFYTLFTFSCYFNVLFVSATVSAFVCCSFTVVCLPARYAGDNNDHATVIKCLFVIDTTNRIWKYLFVSFVLMVFWWKEKVFFGCKLERWECEEI